MHLSNMLPSSESCKLAQASRLSGEKRLSRLNFRAASIQQEFCRYKVQQPLV